jgi:hypothetical protein
MTFCCGSGSVDPCLWLMDPDSDLDLDPDPAIFVINLPRRQQKTNLKIEGTLTSFFKDKKSQRSYKTVGIKVFLLFLLDRRIRILTSD